MGQLGLFGQPGGGAGDQGPQALPGLHPKLGAELGETVVEKRKGYQFPEGGPGRGGAGKAPQVSWLVLPHRWD